MSIDALAGVGFLFSSSTGEETFTPASTGGLSQMGRFHVVYFGSNDVPVNLIMPILDEIGADLTIRRPTNDAEVIEMGKDADGIIMHGSVPFTKEIISQ